MKKAELVSAVAEKTGLSKKDAAAAVDATFGAIADSLVKGDGLSLVGFGTFSISDRKERTGRNPRTNEATVIPASKNVKFKAGKALKDSINA